jgi:hypothetical protein
LGQPPHVPWSIRLNRNEEEMASGGIRVLSIARKSYRAILQHHFFFRNYSNSSSNSNPLLLKLLQLPNSNIKTTLDHEFPSLPTSLLSFDFLITSLSPSSQKPNLVIITIHLLLIQLFFFFFFSYFIDVLHEQKLSIEHIGIWD